MGWLAVLRRRPSAESARRAVMISKTEAFASAVLGIALSILGIVISVNAKQTSAAFVFTACLGVFIGFCIVLAAER